MRVRKSYRIYMNESLIIRLFINIGVKYKFYNSLININVIKIDINVKLSLLPTTGIALLLLLLFYLLSNCTCSL